MIDNKLIENIVLEVITELKNYFLVKLNISSLNHISVFYDADGEGVKINDLTKLNRAIREKIDLENYFPEGNYSLEISSYGLDKPLILHRQYVKNINRYLKVTLNNDTEKIGLLKNVFDDKIEIEITLNKKQTQQVLIPFTDIKNSYIEIKF